LYVKEIRRQIRICNNIDVVNRLKREIRKCIVGEAKRMSPIRLAETVRTGNKALIPRKKTMGFEGY
jgi:hypothetical protein